jgi:hypothetical protein
MQQQSERLKEDSGMAMAMYAAATAKQQVTASRQW